MYQQKTNITAINGLHTRPAVQFVKAAKKFHSNITIVFNNKSVNAKSLLKLQTLGLTHGAVFIIAAEGQDEKEAVEHLVQLIATLE